MSAKGPGLFSGAAHKLMSKSSPCVAMGTGPTLTKGEQKSEGLRETQGEQHGEEGEVDEDPRDKGGRERGESNLSLPLLPIFIMY